MKILLVTPYYHPKIGGLENYARQLALALKILHGHEIVIVTSNHQTKKTIVEVVDDMKIYRLPYWFKYSNTPINPFWPIMIHRIIKREQPAIVHSHTPVPSMSDAAALASGRLPFVITYHAATLTKTGSPIFNLAVALYSHYERITFSRANRIFTVSDFVRDQLKDSAKNKSSVIPNSIWEREIKKRLQPDDPNFIFIGSLDSTHGWKGLASTIHAISEYKSAYDPNVTLTIVGDGDARSRYEELVRNLKIQENVEFVGAKTGTEKDRLLENATALVAYPNSGNDAFPTVFLEAWAKYVPVVAASLGPIPSLIKDGLTGYLIEPNNPKALAAGLFKVASNSESRRRVAANAAKLVRKQYTWENQSARMVQELEALI